MMTYDDTGGSIKITFEAVDGLAHETVWTETLDYVDLGAEHGWSIRSRDISKYAFNVRNRSASWGIPPFRGEDLVVPAAHGRRFARRKKYDSAELFLEMWAVGADPQDGSIPPDKREQVLQNLDELTRLFGGTDQLMEVVRTDGGRNRVALAQVTGGVSMASMAGGTRAEFKVGMTIPSGFWDDMQPVTQTLGIGNTTSIDLEFNSFAGATAPMDHLTMVLSGLMENVLVEDLASGEYFRYNGPLGGLDTLTVDSAAATVIKWDNGTSAFVDKRPLIEQRTSGPFLSFWPTRGQNYRDELSGAIRVRFESEINTGANATLTLTGTRRYFLA
jgi:hypothetical protein